MRKSELVDTLKEAAGLTRVRADECLCKLCDIIAAELLGGGEITLPGIGKLKTRDAAARSGRNPKTGEAIQIPAGKRAVFVAAKELKDSLK